MAAGYELTVQDLKQLGQSFAQQYVALLSRTDAFAQRIADFGSAAITAAYVAANSTTGTQDGTDLEAMINAVQLIMAFSVTQAPAGALSVIDNTLGTAAQTVSIQAGAYCVATSDPILIAILKGVGVDKSPIIRKLSPLSNL